MNKYETIYLNWYNNFYSTKYMSIYYNINQSKLKRQISRGRRIHYKKHNEFVLPKNLSAKQVLNRCFE